LSFTRLWTKLTVSLAPGTVTGYFCGYGTESVASYFPPQERKVKIKKLALKMGDSWELEAGS